jgi:hypothetical protein
MKLLRAAIAEVLGMFIDDGSLALALLVLIGAVTAAVKAGWLGALGGGLALLAGCVALLVESVWRAARGRAGTVE